jgi:hypothetical protein
MNIGHIYSSVTWLHREIYGAGQSQTDDPYIHRYPIQTDEYNFIFVSFKTNKYNLNIFVDIDEYKKTDE